MIQRLRVKPSWVFICLFSDHASYSWCKVSLFVCLFVFLNKTCHSDVLGVINTNNILLVC